MQVTSNSTVSYEDRRDSPRVTVRGLEIAIEQKKWLFVKDYHECLLKDISQSGVGIIASGLTLSPGQMVQLVLADNKFEYLAEGEVVTKIGLEEFDWYGVALNKAPPELDLRISKWSRVAILQRNLKLKQQANKQSNSVLGALPIPDDLGALATSAPVNSPEKYREKKRAYQRYPVPALHGRIRNWGLSEFDKFIDGEIIDISEDGLGFRIKGEVDIGDRVRVEIKSGKGMVRLAGHVRHFSDGDGNITYGLQYSKIPMNYDRFLQIFQPRQS